MAVRIKKIDNEIFVIPCEVFWALDTKEQTLGVESWTAVRFMR